MKRWRDMSPDERRAYATERKRRSRERIRNGESVGNSRRSRVNEARVKQLTGFDAVWEKLKKKHAGKPRLKKSIKPPILLNPPNDNHWKRRKGNSNEA